MLEIFALTLGLAHFSMPLIYYYYLKRHINDLWKLRIDRNHVLPITVIVPTYNEANLIEKKLDNIYEQDYPKDKTNIVLVDSSTDGTISKVKQWREKHKEIKLKIIEEDERKGKAHSLNTALKYVDREIIVLTDADSFWAKGSLKESVKY
ncbi:MAG: glycosyltransferase, partial [archaeon]|nr:glycosyltransferase [archaeon]